jgi:SAM-dependent methyltransferase
MITAPGSGNAHEDVEGVRQFFDQWALYEKVAGNNYLHHREAYAAIERVLCARSEGFSFLDLGAGDARFTGVMLSRLKPGRYHAVDISGTALDLARKNAASLTCPTEFTQADFATYVPEAADSYDVVFIGLSFHHLTLENKRRFFSDVRRIVNQGGFFVFYEPIMEPGETRDGVMGRFCAFAEQWNTLTAIELQQVKEHVLGNDYPETVETFETMARAGGFPVTRVLFTDDARLYAVFQCS